MSFTDLGLAEPILKAVAEQGYDKPSPIQAESIPAVLSGRDVMAAAQTGTGKTAGFTLPLLHLLSSGKPAKANQARALVLTPTRELAAQVHESVEKYSQYLPLRSAVVFGGVKINPQMIKLRQGVDILVATPGRLLDLFNQRAIKFEQLEVLILDEADRMLDMGFIHDIKKILRALPSKRQNLMFSATFSNDIKALAKGLVNDPVEISVTPPNATANTVEQWVYPVDKSQKANVLIQLIKDNDWTQVLVFSRTKHGANRLAKQLTGNGIDSAAIHGNKSQGARTKALADFKSNRIRVLVATDIAARGLDIDLLPHVVNFDLPNVPEDYVHRIGRTGRAGSTGEAVSLVCAEEFKHLSDIERLIQKLIERRDMPGFVVKEALPESRLGRPVRASKPKKPKQGGSGHKDGQRSGENARGHKTSGQNRRQGSGSGGSSNKSPYASANPGGNRNSNRPPSNNGGQRSGNR
jgi:ATP-dependent RNA helicase RhlE